MSISDGFTYSNGNLSGQSGWTTTIEAGTLSIASNALTGVAFESRGHIRTDSWNGTQSSQITISAVGSGMYPAVIVNGSGSGETWSGYILGFGLNGTWTLERYDSGTPTELAGETGTTMVPGDIIRLARETNDIVGYKNGVELSFGRVTDTTYATGKPGIFLYRESTTITIDDWIGTGEIAGSSSIAVIAGSRLRFLNN